MKKLISIPFLVMLLLVPMGCSNSEFRCENCGETKVGKSHKVTIGEDIYTFCDECYREMKGLLN